MEVYSKALVRRSLGAENNRLEIVCILLVILSSAVCNFEVHFAAGVGQGGKVIYLAARSEPQTTFAGVIHSACC